MMLVSVTHSTTFPRTGLEAALAAHVVGGLAVGAFRPAWWWRASLGVFGCSIVALWVAALSGMEGALSILVYPPFILSVPVSVTAIFAASVALARIAVRAMRGPESHAGSP